MPAKGYTDPNALPTRLCAWLREHPGEHRARDVAAGLGAPDGMPRAEWSQKVANALGREVQRGTVRREDRDLGYKRPVGLYSAAETTAVTGGR